MPPPPPASRTSIHTTKTRPTTSPLCVTFQHDHGKSPHPVIDGHLVVTRIPEDFVETLCNSPDSIALIVPFLGNRHLIKSWGHPNLIAAITNILAPVSPTETTSRSYRSCPMHQDVLATSTPPFVLAIHLTIPGLINYLTPITTFICNRDLAFHIIEYNSIPGQSPSSPHPSAKAALRTLDTYTGRWHTMSSTTPRTIDIHYNPHSKHWCVYTKPCTDDFNDWEAIRATMCFVPLCDALGFVMFSPVTTFTKQAPWCLLCKNDDHLYYGCYFTRDTPYWGPFEQISRTTEGILAKRKGPQGGSGNGSNTSGGGASRSGNSGGNRGGGNSDKHCTILAVKIAFYAYIISVYTEEIGIRTIVSPNS
ncbi:hypothetical protein FB451DRAFT_1400332 [Mycena latifolia]|nr:hypothetical protein FB451DRAFT_1400332 [Mycena latifolia]